MRLSEVEKRARSKGITNTWKYSKAQLIKTIQQREGYAQCFSTAARKDCYQMECCWRSDCIA
jgi:hypothetical protein